MSTQVDLFYSPKGNEDQTQIKPVKNLNRDGLNSKDALKLADTVTSYGADNLSDRDLIKLVTGIDNLNFETILNYGRQSGQAWSACLDITKGQAAKLASLVSFACRYRAAQSQHQLVDKRVKNSREVYEAFLPFFNGLTHEEFYCMFLSRAQNILGIVKIGEGGVSATIADPKKIFKNLMHHPKTGSIILAHNHPSGNLQPSPEDKKLTQRVKEIAMLMECPLIDHLIITDSGYRSFADEGEL